MEYSSLREILDIDSSRTIVNIATEFVGTNEILFDEAISMTETCKYPLNMRAARVLEFSSELNPQFAFARIEHIINLSTTSNNDGVKRAFLKITERFLPFQIKDDLLGLVINNCFDKLNGIESVAVKYYAINCLMKIIKKEPDLKNELLISLQDQIGKNTVAFDRYMKKRIKILESK